MSRLLIVLLDPLSDLIEKGEILARYYNPGNVFDDIHFLLLNHDKPEPVALASMCGNAHVAVHNLPLEPGLFLRTLGWQPLLLRHSLDAAAALAHRIAPDVIRAHGAGLNALFANYIGDALQRPVLLSLHNRPDSILADGSIDWLRQKALELLAARTLRAATKVIAVYKSQLPYLSKIGVNAELAYNIIGLAEMPVKASYVTGNPVRALSVGRQFRGKDISNVIEAVAQLPDVHLTVIGDGPLHDALRARALAAGIEGRIQFMKAMANAELCAGLSQYDIFVSHNDHPGIPKAVMEPMLAGLPVVMNRIGDGGDTDLEGAAVLVEDTAAGYRVALSRLMADEQQRRVVGLACRNRAQATWHPGTAERRQAEIIAAMLQGQSASPHAI